jgi:hypothetical protein
MPQNNLKNYYRLLTLVVTVLLLAWAYFMVNHFWFEPAPVSQGLFYNTFQESFDRHKKTHESIEEVKENQKKIRGEIEFLRKYMETSPCFRENVKRGE